MRFGICSKIDQAEALADIGYDFVEWPISATVGKMEEAEYTELKQRVQGWTIRPEAWNVLLPGTIRVTGPDANHSEMVTYLERALFRVAELGGSVVVFGSGRSRQIPDAWSRHQAEEQFIDACHKAGEIAKQNGLVITIEPLNKAEDNLVNTVADGLSFVNRINHPAVRVLSDLYHVAQEDEPFDDTTRAGETLQHVHVATKEERAIPLAGREDGLLESYFKALHRGGYNGRVSVEGKWDMNEAKAGLDYMRETWEKVIASDQ